jgi:hypothetical protein
MSRPIPHTITPSEATFNTQQMITLSVLRELYQEQHGFFTQRELAGLRFVRWLYRTDKLTDGRERRQRR